MTRPNFLGSLFFRVDRILLWRSALKGSEHIQMHSSVVYITSVQLLLGSLTHVFFYDNASGDKTESLQYSLFCFKLVLG